MDRSARAGGAVTDVRMDAKLQNLGAALRNRRRHMKMTLADLSKACGLSVPFLSQLENNNAAPSFASLIKLAEALDIGIEHFVEVPRPKDFVRTRHSARNHGSGPACPICASQRRS